MAFCVFDPLFAASLCVIQLRTVQALRVNIWMFLSVCTRLSASQSSESTDGDSVHLIFTANDWNICVTRTGLSLLLQPYFGGRFPLTFSLFPLSVFLQFVFERRARQNSSRSFPGILMFCWLFLFPAKGIWNRANVRGQDNNTGVLRAGRSG